MDIASMKYPNAPSTGNILDKYCIDATFLQIVSLGEGIKSSLKVTLEYKPDLYLNPSLLKSYPNYYGFFFSIID